MNSGDMKRLPDSDFARWNEEMVVRYDIDRYYQGSHWIVRRIERGRIAAVQKLAAAQSGDRVLEVGCGGGHVLEQFPYAVRTGLDLSSEMLARARARLGIGIRLLRGAAEAIPLADGSCDVVLCTEVLEHTRTPAAVIAELVRVVRPGGRVVVSIPNERNIDRAKRVLRAVPGLRRVLRTLAEEANEWHLHSFDLSLLREAAAGHAVIRRIVGVPAGPFPVRYVALLAPAAANKG